MITAFPEGFLSEDLLREYVDLLVRFVEAAGALIIFLGAVIAAVRFVAAAVRRGRDREFASVRLGLGTAFSMAFPA